MGKRKDHLRRLGMGPSVWLAEDAEARNGKRRKRRRDGLPKIQILSQRRPPDEEEPDPVRRNKLRSWRGGEEGTVPYNREDEDSALLLGRLL